MNDKKKYKRISDFVLSEILACDELIKIYHAHGKEEELTKTYFQKQGIQIILQEIQAIDKESNTLVELV